MAHAERCPLCLGTGNKNGVESNPFGTTEICHGCGGKGWVEVTEESEMYNFWLSYPPPIFSGTNTS